MKSPPWMMDAMFHKALWIFTTAAVVTAELELSTTDITYGAMPTLDIQTSVATATAPLNSASLFELANTPLVNAYNSALLPCPAKCGDTGINPSNWTVYHNVDRLQWCNETMLLDFAIYNPLADPETHSTIRVCSTEGIINPQVLPRLLEREESCIPAQLSLEVEATLQIALLESATQGDSAQVISATQQILGYVSGQDPECKSTILFAQSGSATIGLYAGAQIQTQGVTTAILQQFIDEVQIRGMNSNLLVQLCSTDGRGADYSLGIVASANASLPYVQSVVKAWSDGECIIGYDQMEPWRNTTFWGPTPSNNISATIGSNSSMTTFALHARTTCSPTVQVVSGDSCASLATKCGISGALFTTYNPSTALCSTLAVGQHVCCSAGTLPDFTPKPNPDGSCASYKVVAGDNCAAIAAAHSLTVATLETLNSKTWGWTGCNNLLAGVLMCLSSGTPPMPAPLSNAVCGPQVIGTSPPASGVNLTSLNPCPLNSCCDIWGQCGTTAEFCTTSTSATGAPGTAAPGSNGCISNCGTSIVVGTAPSVFSKIAYFEGFNGNRPCLTMDMADLNLTGFTHVHLAFAKIDPTFGVDISDIEYQFNAFVALKGVKRVLSFGGWSFSTGQDSYPIFRDSVTSGNRNTFVSNIVSFVKSYGLDGVDFDWEYPGAVDIPGVPAGSADEGINYFAFLWLLKSQLPAGVSLSIAAPASYWYLKGFPINAIGIVVDYIIYMTYDLHGQWDYGNQWSDPGCPAGNCLRSHVNFTETVNALSMITKAGVPSSKVMVGVTSYGRSFEMTKSGCTGEMCTYSGPDSQATPGECTGTPGYIADAELKYIMEGGGSYYTFRDNSVSDILVYNDTQWVAYMDDSNKASRSAVYQWLNLGGTSDWAVDLDGDDLTVVSVLDCPNTYTSVDDVVADTTIPDDCVNIYLIDALAAMLEAAVAQYSTTMQSDYDSKFEEYAKAIKAQAPDQMGDFYANHVDEFFTCTYAVYTDGIYVNHTNLGCPPNNEPYQYNDFAYNIYMIPNDLETFYTYIESSYGLDRSWVTWPTIRDSPCVPPQDCNAFGNVIGTPSTDPNLVVPDPKDYLSKSLTNLTALQNQLADIAADAHYQLFPGDCADVADSSSMPVYMAQSAVASMAQVVTVAGTIEVEKRKEEILFFLSGILLVLPFLGEALTGLTGFALIARFATMIGTVGDAAMGIYGSVELPSTTPMMIVGMLLGGLFSADARVFSDAAILRRAMTSDKVAELGTDVAAGMTKVSKTFKICKI